MSHRRTPGDGGSMGREVRGRGMDSRRKRMLNVLEQLKLILK